MPMTVTSHWHQFNTIFLFINMNLTWGLNEFNVYYFSLRFVIVRHHLYINFNRCACWHQVWKLSSCDLCEIARNSVYQSGFDHRTKVCSLQLQNSVVYSGDTRLNCNRCMNHLVLTTLALDVADSLAGKVLLQEGSWGQWYSQDERSSYACRIP